MKNSYNKENMRSRVLTNLRKEHEGKWVAVSSDYKKIVGYSESLQELEKMVKGAQVVFFKKVYLKE